MVGWRRLVVVCAHAGVSPAVKRSSQKNGMVRVIKDAMKCCNPAKCSVQAFIHCLLMVHRNSSMRVDESTAEIMLGRTLQCPITSHLRPMQQLLYKLHSKAMVTPIKLLFKQGRNTLLLAHDAQIAEAPNRSQRIRRPVRCYPDLDPRLEGKDVT